MAICSLPPVSEQNCSLITQTKGDISGVEKILETMPRIASKIGATLTGKNLLPLKNLFPGEQFLSFKSIPYIFYVIVILL